MRGAAGQLEIHSLDPTPSRTGRAALSPEIMAVLEDQLLLAAEDAGEGFAGRFGSAGQVSVNLLRHAGWADEAEALQQAVAEGLRLGRTAPFTAMLRELIREPPPASAGETPGPAVRDPTTSRSAPCGSRSSGSTPWCGSLAS